MGTAINKVTEFFLLRDLELRAREVPAEEHAAAAGTHARARQKRDAAEALWIAGYPAEALRLAHVALELLEPAAAETASLPELDADVKPEHAERFRALLADIERRMEQGRAAALDVREIASTRVRRIAIATAAGLAVLALLILVVRTPKVLKAEASSQYAAQYDPARAIDDSDKTEWLLPDRSGGWIDVTVQPARKLSKLKLLNARNLPYADRGTNEFHVDVYDKGQIVKQLDGKFDALSSEPTWRTFDLGLRADKVRVTVKSWFQQGGGLAEIHVE